MKRKEAPITEKAVPEGKLKYYANEYGMPSAAV